MIILSATTDILEVVLGGAVTTNQARCVASWRDITTTGFTPDRTVILTNSATPVNAVGSPAASTQRVIDLLNVYNSDTVAATVTVQYNANGTRYVLWSGSLATLESVQYVEGAGWQKLTASGMPASSAVSAVNGTTAEITASTASGVVTLSLPTALTFTGKTVTGGTFNVGAISGTTGTFSGGLVATAANGVLITSSDANATGFGKITPSGSGTQSNLILYAGSDTANTNWLNIKASTSETMLDTNKAGTGTTQTLNLKVAGTTVAAITSTGLAVTGALSSTDPAGGAGPSWKLGVAASVSPTSPNRTVRIDIAGTSYYLAAKTTND